MFAKTIRGFFHGLFEGFEDIFLLIESSHKKKAPKPKELTEPPAAPSFSSELPVLFWKRLAIY
jgi:hypothetical protein